MADFKHYENLEVFFSEALSLLYSRREADQIFLHILHHYLGWSRMDFYRNCAQRPAPEFVEALRAILSALLTHRPIQYILGTSHFFGLELKVDENVLIPRPETEELVAMVLEEQGAVVRSLLDIGTGSGAIALAIQSKRPKWDVTAIDIAAGALKCATDNAESNRLPVVFRQLDIAATSQWETLPGFDLIVSNPPYVQQPERAQMRPNVLDYEPHVALFAPAGNPLYFYEVIADFALQKLQSGGTLYFEINPYLSRKTLQALIRKGFKAELRKDLSAKERFVVAKRNGRSTALAPS